MKVLVKILDIVPAGFAKEVDDVNQYPAVINKATPIATEFSSFFLINKIVDTKPNVAMISLTKSGQVPLTLSDTWIIFNWEKKSRENNYSFFFRNRNRFY